MKCTKQRGRRDYAKSNSDWNRDIYIGSTEMSRGTNSVFQFEVLHVNLITDKPQGTSQTSCTVSQLQ